MLCLHIGKSPDFDLGKSSNYQKSSVMCVRHSLTSPVITGSQNFSIRKKVCGPILIVDMETLIKCG